MNNIIIREIQEADLEKGFLESLDNLKKASDLEKNNAKTILKKILDDSNHIIHIAELDGKIVGSTTLLIEQKFIHKGGVSGSSSGPAYFFWPSLMAKKHSIRIALWRF